LGDKTIVSDSKPNSGITNHCFQPSERSMHLRPYVSKIFGHTLVHESFLSWYMYLPLITDIASVHFLGNEKTSWQIKSLIDMISKLKLKIR